MDFGSVVGMGIFGWIPVVYVAGAVGIGIAALVTSDEKDLRMQPRFARRGKRATDEKKRISRYFEIIKAEDVTGCGLRMACDLGAIPQQQITNEIAAIMAFIGPAIIPGEGVLPSDAQEYYRQARGLGTLGAENCVKQFSMCPIGGEHLLNTVNAYLP